MRWRAGSSKRGNTRRSGATGRRAAAGLAVAAVLLAPQVAARATSAEPAAAQPIPSWVVPIDLEPPPAAPAEAPPTARPAAAKPGGRVWLMESQLRIPGRGEPTLFRRMLVELPDRLALEQWSALELGFAPPFQRLHLHRVRVRRDGAWSDRMAASEQRVVQRESELGENIVSGQRSVLLVPADLRAGDWLEAAWSVTGANSVLDGHASTELRLAPPGVRRRRVEILAEPGATVALRVLGGGDTPPATPTPSGGRRWSWDVEPPIEDEAEPFVPADVLTEPWLQISGFESWAEVATWGARLYAGAASAAALEGVVTPWRGLGAEAGVLAALRFVQGEVRYLSLHEGELTMRPRAPEQVLANRWGDCKDKSRLLLALLERLGVTARPVLVSSWRGAGLAEVLPSPGAFDHVVVAAEVEGRRVWLDPTLAPQSASTLDRIWIPRYRLGLELAPGVTALSEIPEMPAARDTRDVLARYEVAPDISSWRVEIETLHRGQAADDLRETLATAGRESLEEGYREYYRRDLPELAADPLEVREQPGSGGVLTVERYRHTTPDARFTTLPLDLAGLLPRLDDAAGRRFPIQLPYPLAREERVHVDSAGTRFEPVRHSIETPWYRLQASSEERPGHLEILYRLETLRDRVEVADAARYVSEVAKLDEVSGYSLWNEPPQRHRTLAALVLLLPLAILAFLGRWVRSRLRALAAVAP